MKSPEGMSSAAARMPKEMAGYGARTWLTCSSVRASRPRMTSTPAWA
jgi:hypothetical protein